MEAWSLLPNLYYLLSLLYNESMIVINVIRMPSEKGYCITMVSQVIDDMTFHLAEPISFEFTMFLPGWMLLTDKVLGIKFKHSFK